MKKQLLQSAAATVLVMASVAAVGTPAMAQVPVPMPIYNWTGFYLGGNVGYSWGRGALNYNEPALASFGLPTSISGSNRLNGGIGGVQFGYNWQVATSWVAGLETDFQVSSERATRTSAYPFTFNDGESIGIGTLSATLTSKIMSFGTVRGRFGFLVTPTTLLYATGGLAYGEVGVSGTLTSTAGLPGVWSFYQNAFRFGYAAGAGIEGLIPTTRNWTWKVEYLHIDLGTLSGSGFDNTFGGPFYWNAKFTDDIARIGFNYHAAP